MKYQKVIEKIQAQESRGSIIPFILKEYGVDNRRAGEIYRREKAKVDNPTLQISDKYVWNRETDKYVVTLKCRQAPLVISGAKHRAICRDYSAWHGDLTAHDICVKYSLTPEIFNEYRRIFNLTKEREPLSAEEVWDNEEEESVEAILEQKRYSIYQKYEREDWNQTQKDAEKWRAFEARQLDPFVRFLDSWEPKAYKPYQVKLKPTCEGYTFLVVVNDIHIGAFANSKYLVKGRDFSSKVAVDLMRKYGEKIQSDILGFKLPINKICICLLGDIINSANPFGTTTKGTPLRNDLLNEELFETAFDCLSEFIFNVSKLAPETSVFSTKGNHDGLKDSILAVCLSKYFKDQKNISFNVSYKPSMTFLDRGTLFLLSHGADNAFKAKAPKSGPKLESYIQSLMINSPDFSKAKNKVAILADLHHLKIEEFNDFHYILAPSLVTGDEYSDALCLHSRPSQICLLMGDDGIKSIFNYYF